MASRLISNLLECFINHLPIKIVPNIINQKAQHLVNEEIVNDNDFEKSEAELETYKSKEDLKYPPE